MKGLVKIPESMIVKIVVPVLASDNRVAGAYLFGSALDYCRPDSDVDIGIVLKPLSGLPEKYYEKAANGLFNRLLRIENHPFDFIPLNIVSSIFAFNVIKKGHLIYNGDTEILSNFIEIISRNYSENYPRDRDALKAIRGV